MTSLRGRLLVASVLWTSGLLLGMHMLTILLLYFFPVLRGRHSAMAILAALALMAAGLELVRRTVAPLRNLRERLERVRAGREQNIAGSYPDEVRPLIEELNLLIEEREKSVRRAVAVAGDLAHGLKTPLALLSREAETLAAQGKQEAAEAVARQVDKMSRQIDYHLARARASAASQSGCVDVSAALEALVRTMHTLHAGRGLEIAIEGSGDVRIGPEDFDEILGNLIDNACKWARTRVKIRAVPEGAFLQIRVEDDGTGIPAPLREAVMRRGVRADEAAPGSGLGLAIARDLCEVYGGEVTLADSTLGGVNAVVRLPRRPDPVQ